MTSSSLSDSLLLTFFADEIPILPEEAEEMFRVRIQMRARRDYFRLPPYSVHQCFPELSAMCGFDPALDGVDICDHFGWYPWEKFDEPSGGGDRSKHSHNAADFSQLMYHQESRSTDRNSSSGIVELSGSNIDNDDDPKMTLTSSDVSADEDQAIQDIVATDDDPKITLTSSDVSADEARVIQATGTIDEISSDLSTGKCSDKRSSDLSVVRQDIGLSSPHASSLQTSDSDHAHPLVSLKRSQTEHELGGKGKRRTTDEDQQRDSAEEDRFYRGRYVHRCDAGTSLTGDVQTTYNREDGDTAGIPSVGATMVSVESVDFTSQSDSHTSSSDALISEASGDPGVFPGHWLDYPDVKFPHPDKPTVNRGAAISPDTIPSTSDTSNDLIPVSVHANPPTAPPPAKRRRTEYNPPPRPVKVCIKNIAWTDDATSEVRTTISEVLGPAADGVTTLPSFYAMRGGDGNLVPFAYFIAPSIDWARWFCRTWNRAVISTEWRDSSAFYEIVQEEEDTDK
ncbi:uncharacterized protein ARMOST_21843 [Armillaria ostoyae]|uniref:Uncharacterized protein n=1 Tax=Armillaria ostoyae TaxID=47428 RepID=A0A284SB71_ARMOS|nr:uncharacterized protein ARMOST_21843 [Armillaria ostoyae]